RPGAEQDIGHGAHLPHLGRSKQIRRRRMEESQCPAMADALAGTLPCVGAAAMSTAILIFAKAPRAGLAKTRLIPALGPEGAAQLAGRMLEHAVQQAMETGVEHIELCVTPDASHPAFQALAQQHDGRLAFSQ